MTVGELMDTEKFQEEFAKSQVFDADKFEEENRKERSARILSRYNDYHNLETSGLPHGMPITVLLYPIIHSVIMRSSVCGFCFSTR